MDRPDCAKLDQCQDTAALDSTIHAIAQSAGIALRPDLTYSEDAERIRRLQVPGAEWLADCLEIAEKRWFELL